MDISGIVQSYDHRTSTSALSRAIMAPDYMPVNGYSGTTSAGIVAPSHHQQQQHHPNHNQLHPSPFQFPGYVANVTSSALPTSYQNNYIQQRPLPRMVQTDSLGERDYYHRNQRRDFIQEHSQSPVVKHEQQWNTQQSPATPVSVPAPSKNITSVPGPTVNFGTEVDTLMKAIQAKTPTTQPQTKSTPTQSRPVDTPASQKIVKKRYQCTISGCSKTFYQKTHLDIHERAHTGDKPYPCKEPGCGRSFSQLGNLKTHERRHTGERPYKCDMCDKRFAQRGNVRAHRIVHDHAKPYLCRLDDCGKQFTQLGNLKSHQNKFHIETIRKLTNKFASFREGDPVSSVDKELWEYFANLYKNSNKGIKGRGKDRKVGTNHMSLNSSLRGLAVNTAGGYGMSGAGRSMVMGQMGAGMVGAGRSDGSYDMFDVDDDSQASIHSGTASSVSTCYEDAPSDVFEDPARGSALAFGDRIY